MSDNEFDDIMKAMPSNISKLDSVYMCFKDEHDKWCDSIKNAYAENNDKGMGEHGWVKLPVSEDGDVLHIGELVDEKLPFGGYAAPAPIDTMELSRGASGYVWMVKLDAKNRALVSPKLLHHHHKQAVEATLGEEIVRCRDCEYVTDEGYGCKYFSHYEQGASYRWEDVPAEVEPDGFCAWASRKESE